MMESLQTHMNKKAYPLFKDGHVQSIRASFSDEKVTYMSKCLPEMKKNITYTINLVVSLQGGDIVSASCGCPAGMGPHGSCKHIAAMCYTLEDFTKLKVTTDHISCTSKLQKWN